MKSIKKIEAQDSTFCETKIQNIYGVNDHYNHVITGIQIA